MPTIRQTIYTFPLNSNPDEFIAVKHGETGYYKTTVYTQDHADELNKRHGVSAVECKAAKICSMTGDWNDFDSKVASLTAYADHV